MCNAPRRVASTLNTRIGVSDFHNYFSAAMLLHAPEHIKHKINYRSFKNFNEDVYKRDIGYLPLQVAEVFDDVNDKL